MEKKNIFKQYSSFSIILLITALFLKGASSEVYKVGGDEGWDTEVDFADWAKKYNFSLGDILDFTYENNNHNVYEVTEATYQSCNASSGVLARYQSGNDQIVLTEAKKYWFICNFSGHCQGGMRFGIDVKGTTSSDPSAPIGQPNNSCKSSYAFTRWSLGIYLAAYIGLLLKL